MFYSLTMLFPGLPGQVMPSEKVHEKMFVGCDRRFKKPSYPAVSRYNKKRTAEEVEKMTHRLLRKEAKLRKKLAARGIDYNFPGFVSIQISLSKWSLCTWRVPAVSQYKPRFSTVFFSPVCTGATEVVSWCHERIHMQWGKAHTHVNN